MNNDASKNLSKEVPANIVKWASLEKTMNDLFNTFEAGEQRNAELINRFFDQPIFYWEESLIDKITEIEPNLKFDDIQKEQINLATLIYDNWMWDFNDCMNKIGNIDIKKAFVNEIYNKVRTQIWVPTAPYNDFDRECSIPLNANVVEYFQKIVNYLESKELAGRGSKKAIEILKNINISNEDLNNGLPAGMQIPSWVNLTDPSIPANTKQDFDTLLSFEIGKEADRTISIAKDFSKTYEWLLTNSIPAINTIVWENDEYRYDEEIISNKYPDYQTRKQAITDDDNLTDYEKATQIKALKREFYLQYLKTKNSKIWNAMEQLYNNDFDYSKVDPAVLKDYFDKVADIRLKMLVDKWMNEFLSLNWWNFDEFRAFYKELTDTSNPVLNLRLSNVNRPWSTTIAPITWDENLIVHKKIKEWPNNWLKDIDEFWKNAEKSHDAFPMEFTINKADIESMNITIEDKTKLLNFLARFDQWDKYEIKWENIWNLIYLFFVINSRLPITNFNLESQKKIEELFGKAKNNEHEEWENDEENDEENKEENEEDESTKEEYLPAKFKEEIEKLWQWNFENWSEIWLPVCDSELPGGWYWRMKVKISNVDLAKWTFKWTVHWWELEFDSKLEWKSKEFKMTKETLEEFNKVSKDSNKVWLLPNPDSSDFNSFRDKLGGKLWTGNLAFPPSWATWTGDKFMQKIIDEDWKEKEVEVKYFWASADDKSVYKVEYNPIRKTFTVSSSFNWDEKWKDGKSEKKRFSYKRDMDWNNFLIFFTQKWLVPQTEEEANSALARQEQEFKAVNGGKWTLNWFSFNNVKNWLKDIFWAIKKKIDDYDKSQTEKFKWIVEWPILNTIWSIPFLPPSIKNAIWERQQEIYNEELNSAWKEIEGYLKALQSDGQFADTFDQVPAHVQTLYGKSYQQFIKDLFNKWNPSKEESRKAAALLLANVQKWGSPYRGLSGEENSWLWIKVILGNNHYEQFLRDKQKCINKLKAAWKEKDQIQDVLATCEVDYIINNVTWANWKLEFFGSHEWRWIPGKEWTNYIPNPSKRLLSEKFANELKSSYQWWFNKSAVEEAFGKISHNDFNLAKEDFKRLLKSSRFPWAIANLKKMFMLAKNPEQKSEYQKCFLLYMLSGVLDVNGKKDLRKQTYQWAKTMWFLPGMLAKETNHSQKVATLLDDFCQEEGYWKFSDSVKSYFREWDLKNWKLNIDKLIWELDSRWDTNKMEAFEKYSKSKFPAKTFPENSILKKLQGDALDSGMENIDNSLLDNPLVANSWWLLSNANVVRDRMAIKDWSFDWKDPDERNNRAEFWKQIAKEVGNMNPDSSESVNLVLNQYFSRFGLNSEYDRQESYEWISTAYYWKDRIWREVRYKYNWRNDKELTMWKISPEDIKDILRYTFKWKVMSSCFSSRRIPSELNDALDNFQKFFEKAFDNNLLQDNLVVSQAFKSWDIPITPMFLWSRELYKDVLSGGDNDFADDIWIWDDDFTDPKQRRKAQKKVFQTWWFINHKIAQIEKSLKKLPSGMYRPITQDVNHNIESLVRLL